MKKLLFGLLAILISSGIAFGQNAEPGTAPDGGNSERGVNANGLTAYYSETGNFTLSADGGGSTASTYTVDVDKPHAGATVHKAFLLLAPLWTSSSSGASLAGVPIVWDDSSPNTSGGTNYIDDVTSIVAPIIDPAAPGITSLTVLETGGQDGTALLVIFNDPLAGSETIVIMFGGLSTAGDNFSLTLGTPIDPIAPGALLDMGLGISYGAQGTTQYSTVDINGVRLTTSAGGQDDGSLANGALITVGGIGDLNTNPADPFALPVNERSDDELYSLLPLITNTTTNILVATSNPSNDDNIFLSYFEISGAAIIGEGILLSQTTNVENLGANHTVKALVQDNAGNPVVGTMVDFEILSGPNAGNMFSVATDASGCAFYTYQGTGGPGVDVTEACFVNSQGATQCSNHLSVSWGGNVPVPVSNWAILLGIFLIAAFTVVRYRRRLA